VHKVLVCSWWFAFPQQDFDTQGFYSSSNFPLILAGLDNIAESEFFQRVSARKRRGMPRSFLLLNENLRAVIKYG
jgi:hypothetical protein